MKLVHLSFQVQYADPVERLLERHRLKNWVRYGRIAGHDRDGRHDGSQAFPGNVTAVQVLVPDDRLDGLLDDLEDFRNAKRVHRHLVAAVMPVERSLGGDAEPDDEEHSGSSGGGQL